MAHKITPDRIIIAHLSGASSRHAAWRMPEGQALAAALAELRDIATVTKNHRKILRTDLLAESAGIMLGAADVKGPGLGLQYAA